MCNSCKICQFVIIQNTHMRYVRFDIQFYIRLTMNLFYFNSKDDGKI
nr:MAG TPA: hypothetical protein [Caudoviricetes sp.]